MRIGCTSFVMLSLFSFAAAADLDPRRVPLEHSQQRDVLPRHSDQRPRRPPRQRAHPRQGGLGLRCDLRQSFSRPLSRGGSAFHFV